MINSSRINGFDDVSSAANAGVNQSFPMYLGDARVMDWMAIDNLLFKAAKKMVQVYCTPAKGKLDGNTVGKIDGLSNENIVEIFYPGKEQACAEWKAYMLNRAVGLIVPDTNGNNRL